MANNVVDVAKVLLSRPRQTHRPAAARRINWYLAETNDNPKSFTWTADPDVIIEKVRRRKQVLESIR